MCNINIDFIKSIVSIGSTDYIYNNLKDIFAFNQRNEPNVVDGEILYWAWKVLQRTSKEMEQELMYQRFYKNSKERYDEFLKEKMMKIKGGSFLMGSASDAKLKYCGEEPLHKVTLNTFYVSNIVIPQELYIKYNPFYEMSNGENFPITKVSWYDAVMFSKWIDCRLLTEAEWEYASRGTSEGMWCCEKEEDLKDYAWYSESSDGYVHQMALLKPNSNGLYDIHGNVWEWCQDSYEEEYYSHSVLENPVNESDIELKVCRGGSIHGFSEMCRCSFRDYEPASFKANDIGFRVARDKE